MSRVVSRASSIGPSRSFIHPSRQSSTLNRTGRPITTATSVASQDIVCAISESRGVSSTVGLAFVNLSTAEAVLCQISDGQSYAKTLTKIGVFEPTELLLMGTAKEAKLHQFIQANFPGTLLTFLDRRYWAENVGHEYVERLAFTGDADSIKVTLGGNYFAACCFAAAIKYVELELNQIFTSHSLRIRFEPSQGSMSIDLSTVISLELIQNLHDTKSKESLFGLLNETLTPMGSRLLRTNILQPSTEGSILTARYEAVEDLSTKQEMFVSVRQALKGFVDADKVLSALILVPTKRTFLYVEQSVNHVIMLKTYISAIDCVYRALATAQSSLLLAIREICAPAAHCAVTQLIEATLNDDVSYQTKPLDLRNQRIYCVKAGVSSLLDVARQTYKEGNSDAAELVAQLSENHDLGLDLKYDQARQYYISLPATGIRALSDIFINVYRKKNRIECQTLDLVKLNQKIADAHAEVITLSDKTVLDLIESVIPEVSILFKISETIAMLDILAAFAQLATTNEYIQPELKTDVLAIKSGRHPIREKIHTKKFIPNDVYATHQTRFQIITGCNMSGKSTYIRSLALMSIMAQIGSFVPAEYASFPIFHQLFARVSTADDLEANVSTFAAEMCEMAFILHNLNPRGLVIIDELGRGTGTTDGLAIALAIAEALVLSNALVWFVTHFQDLATIMAERPGVASLHLAADIAPDASKMTMYYKITEGPNRTQSYGLALANLVELPRGIIDKAQNVSEELGRISLRRHGNQTRARAITRRRKLLLSLKEQVLQARDGSMEGDTLRSWLGRLQDEFALQMAAANEQIAGRGEISDESEGEGEGESIDESEAIVGNEGNEYGLETQLFDELESESVSESSQTPMAFLSTAEWPTTDSLRKSAGKPIIAERNDSNAAGPGAYLETK
ncbi:muts domain V-domain-containing protein [Aspergillus pseudoustus]|uniref:Muts domain V-domain-containing protein n=1 Tax=Aspergillus pseudoustus TaxID=1810923 RepID=A0ABR4KJR6_9EURO